MPDWDGPHSWPGQTFREPLRRAFSLILMRRLLDGPVPADTAREGRLIGPFVAESGSLEHVRALPARKETSMVRFGRITAVLLMVVAVLVGAPTSLFAQAKIRVAVMNFENNSTWAWWGDNLGAAAADELATQLGADRQVHRCSSAASWPASSRNRTWAPAGPSRGATAAKVGKLLGVQLHSHRLDHGLLDQAHLDWPARHRRQLLERREQGGCPPGQHRDRRSDAGGRGPGQQAHGRRLLQGRERRADLRPGRGAGSAAAGRRTGGRQAHRADGLAAVDDAGGAGRPDRQHPRRRPTTSTAAPAPA